MKRSLTILVLSIVWSLMPSAIVAWHTDVPRPDSVSLLVMDTSNSRWKNLQEKASESLEKVPELKILINKQWKNIEDIEQTPEISKTLEQFQTLKKQNLPNLVKEWWYEWKTDRIKLANELWIDNYIGSMEQNTLIQNYLLSKIKIIDRVVPEITPDIIKTKQQIKEMEKQPLFVYAKSRWYIREIDRNKLANEVGIVNYKGNREQNLLIKKYLRNKLRDQNP